MIRHQDVLIERLRDPVEALGYFKVSQEIFNEDRDVDVFISVLDDIIEAQSRENYIFIQLALRVIRTIVKFNDDRIDDAFLELKEFQALDLQTHIDRYVRNTPLDKLGTGHTVQV